MTSKGFTGTSAIPLNLVKASTRGFCSWQTS
uniref:Uncharacterized protein n=1 Tax=Trichinella nativa TaxID=6335 RepID=A0A0V1KIP2_9BILA